MTDAALIDAIRREVANERLIFGRAIGEPMRNIERLIAEHDGTIAEHLTRLKADAAAIERDLRSSYAGCEGLRQQHAAILAEVSRLSAPGTG